MERWSSMCTAAPFKGYGTGEDSGVQRLAVFVSPIVFELTPLMTRCHLLFLGTLYLLLLLLYVLLLTINMGFRVD